MADAAPSTRTAPAGTSPAADPGAGDLSPLPDGRITLLLTSPRVGPGQMTWPAWERLRAADDVLAADPGPAWLQALADAGVTPEDVAGSLPRERAGLLVDRTGPGRDVVWLGSPDGDPGLTDALAEHLSRRAQGARPPELEILTASYDVPGSRLLDVVTVMDRLRSPGGCPWDAEQTHTSLLPYLLEETHEVVEAVENDDRVHLQEELGDLLLQVAFHARIAEEHAEAPFGIDDVAAGIVLKLVRRHPHVFGDGDAETPADVERSWEELKAAEKPDRGLFDGIPATLPALARAQKMLGRLERSGADLDDAVARAAQGDDTVAALLHAVLATRLRGDDAEAVLRAALTRWGTLPVGEPRP
jgi:XTP/dITP diphosphohydrolase